MAATATSDVIDDDTLAAVLNLWGSVGATPLKQPPQTGRLKAQAPPYAVLASELDSRDLAGVLGGWHDKRKVTIAIYGLRADVVKTMAAALVLFNIGLGKPGQPTLTYPSGAPFLQWWPLDGGVIEEDPDVKAGEDQWRGIITARVWSVRAN